jgi:hypothetical protein
VPAADDPQEATAATTALLDRLAKSAALIEQGMAASAARMAASAARMAASAASHAQQMAASAASHAQLMTASAAISAQLMQSGRWLLEKPKADKAARNSPRLDSRVHKPADPLQEASDRARSAEKRRFQALRDSAAAGRRGRHPKKITLVLKLLVKAPGKPIAGQAVPAPMRAPAARPPPPPPPPPEPHSRQRPRSPLAERAADQTIQEPPPAAAGAHQGRARRKWPRSDPQELRRRACLRASRKGAPYKP